MKTRTRATDLRLRVRCAQDAVRDGLRHFDESRADFMKAIRTSRTEIPDHLVQRLEIDEDDLRQKIAELHDSYDDLNTLDEQLWKEDGDEAGSSGTDFLQSLSDTGKIMYKAYDDNESEPEMPSLLREYFDVIGELRLMKERLEDELPYEHADQKLRRQRLMDQDEVLSMTEEDFEAKCHEEVQVVHGEINALTIRVNKLHAEVMDAGLDPDPTRYRRETPSGSVVEWLDSVAATVDVSSDPLGQTQPLPPTDWLDSIATPAMEVSPEQFGQVHPLPDDAVMPIPEFELPEWDGQPAESEHEAFYSSTPRADLNEGLDGSLPPSGEDIAGASVRSAADSDPDLQKTMRRDDVGPQWLALLEFEPIRQESSDESTTATNTSDGSTDNFSAVIDGDPSVQYGPFSSGSIEATVYHGFDTGHGAQLAAREGEDNGDEAGHHCDHEEVVLFTISGIAMLQPQQQDYFVRGVVFETSLAEPPHVPSLPPKAIVWGSRTTLMVFKRNAKDCVAWSVQSFLPHE
ncbi:unnamed protein product [Cercospora beticola]|nr:unnamed protein product [Cercospora beticola]